LKTNDVRQQLNRYVEIDAANCRRYVREMAAATASDRSVFYSRLLFA